MKTAILFNILLVEDNELIRQAILRLLKKEGHSVEVAGNGMEAVALLENKLFDLVLMDIQMPEMDGFEATRTIRDTNSKVLDHEIPVIAFTSFECTESCLKAGMDAYVPKPFKIEELYHSLNTLAAQELSKERSPYQEKKP